MRLALAAPRLRTPWKTVYHSFRLWRLDGTWRSSTRPSASACGSASGEIGNPARASSIPCRSRAPAWAERGYDGGKQIKGRKRHLLVDTEGFLLKAKVHAANIFDRDGIKLLLEEAKELFPRLSHLWLDAGYNGEDKGKDWVEKVLGWTAQIVKRPRRWVRVPKDEKPPPTLRGSSCYPGGGGRAELFVGEPKP